MKKKKGGKKKFRDTLRFVIEHRHHQTNLHETNSTVSEKITNNNQNELYIPPKKK